MSDAHRDIIARVAEEEGIDPAYALAVAERESKFNPNARASRTIAGMFQMSGALRHRYGIGDSTDPETQARGFAAFTRDLRAQMASDLGREPTHGEVYLGHHWGGPRAARVIGGRYGDAAPADVFTPNEMAQNPEFRRHRTMGSLSGAIMGDIDKRHARHGGTPAGADGVPGLDFASFGEPQAGAPNSPTSTKMIDLAQFGQPQEVDFSSFGQPDQPAAAPGVDLKVNKPGRPGTEIDLSQFGGRSAQRFAGDDDTGELGPVAHNPQLANAGGNARIARDIAQSKFLRPELPRSGNIDDRRGEPPPEQVTRDPGPRPDLPMPDLSNPASQAAGVSDVEALGREMALPLARSRLASGLTWEQMQPAQDRTPDDRFMPQIGLRRGQGEDPADYYNPSGFPNAPVGASAL